MGKKNLLARILVNTGLLPIIGKLNSLFSKKIVILAYHRIYDIHTEDEFPFDPELISASTEQFKAQMVHIKNHFNPVSFKTFTDHLDGKSKLPKRPVIITFDDGHKDNYTHAYPILKDLTIPATIFLSTGYIDSEEIFWFDWVAYMLFRTTEKEICFPDNKKFEVNTDITSRRESTENILRYFKTLSNQDRLDYLTILEQQAKVSITESDKKLSSALTWDEIKEMHNNGIEFGSHTVSHPILSKLNPGELETELENSKLIIEEKLNQPIDIIAYPVGGKNEYSEAVISKCKQLGYRLGVSYISGYEPVKPTDLFRIKRLHVERYTDLTYFKTMLELPEVFK